MPADTSPLPPLAIQKHRTVDRCDHLGEFKRLDLLNTGVGRTLHESHQLIRQTRSLHVRTMALLNELEGRTWSRGCREVPEPTEFVKGQFDPAMKWVIDVALRITNADMANIQLVDPVSGGLCIVAQCGFDRPFLEFFDRVHEGSAACGSALRNRERVMVEDVTHSPIFRDTNALEVLLDARVRAVQSSPVIGASGAILGVVSTHWTSPRRLTNQEEMQLNFLARTFANCLQCRE